MGWYIVEKGEAAGPFKESEIRRWLKSGKLSAEIYATREGLDEWRPIIEQLDLAGEPEELTLEKPEAEPEEGSPEEEENNY